MTELNCFRVFSVFSMFQVVRFAVSKEEGGTPKYLQEVCLSRRREREIRTILSQKFFPLHLQISFPQNDVCDGDNDDRNGTCFTSEECSDKGEKKHRPC